MTAHKPQTDRKTATQGERQWRHEERDNKAAAGQSPANGGVDDSLQQHSLEQYSHGNGNGQPQYRPVPIQVDSLRGKASESSRQNHQEQDDRERVRRMAQVYRESLQERDLDQHE